MNLDLYNNEFFEWHLNHVHNDCVSAGFLLPKYYYIKSAYDFGCGIGSFLQGIKIQNSNIKVTGFEIGVDAKKYINKTIRRNIKTGVNVFELEGLKRRNLSICLEVAEHIDPENSEKLVNLICESTNKYIIFSAAPAEQDGLGHINCHDKQYWIDLFKKHDWDYDELRTNNLLNLWHFIPEYYLNNIMVFV